MRCNESISYISFEHCVFNQFFVCVFFFGAFCGVQVIHESIALHHYTISLEWTESRRLLISYKVNLHAIYSNFYLFITKRRLIRNCMVRVSA